MRRTARLALGVLAATTLVLTPAMVGTSAAAPAKGAAASQSAAKKPAKPAKAAKPTKKPAKPAKPAKSRNAKAKVVVVGVVTATQTVTTSGSDTATVLITVRVQGGDREYKGLTRQIAITKDTVVKRNHGKKTRYELQVGDKVTVHARRAEDRSLTAYYVAASGRNRAPQPVATEPSSTNTATTTATTS